MTTTRTPHRRTREQDEYTCTCGLRWDVKEDDPHWMREPRYRKLTDGRIKDCETGYVSSPVRRDRW